MLNKNLPPTKRTGLIALALASTLFVTSRKVYEYSADPQGEKECPPLFAESAEAPLPSEVESTATGADLPWAQRGGTINDASCLSETYVHGIVQVTILEDIEKALSFARDNRLKAAIAGIRHSMGGHAFFKNAVVLDMTRFNQMTLDEENKVLTVQSGATWHDIQSFLHPRYAVKAMQSTDIFT
ncbi:MAG: FAD-dependent oxidoreductase, partial [Ardenticatenales bacterium]|nr:FAD-dependent oxidoreductase [Ardenticatenales bacterium]